MSDAYYQERAKRRTRMYLIVGAIAVAILLVTFAVLSLFRDSCTRGFDRTPAAIVSAFLDAVGRGDVPAAQECWRHEVYYELEAGCSEICLSKVYGAQFRVSELSLGEADTTPEGRANMQATVTIACTASDETHTAEITLDSVGSNLPWRHWEIIHSTFGGTIVEPWCK